MSRTNRLFIYGPFALFALLVLTISLRWWVEAEAFAKRLDAMNGQKIAPGITLHFEHKQVGGFPFRLDATIKDIRIDVETPHGPSEWQAQDFALHRLTYGARRTLFEAAGHQILSWTSEDGRHHALPLETGSMRASAIEDDRGLARFDLDIIAIGTPRFAAAQAQLHIRRDPQIDAIDIAVSASDIRLPAGIRALLGEKVVQVRLGATAVPGKVFEALRAGRAEWPDSLRTFASARGGVHVDEFDLVASALTAEGHGIFSLDSAIRPNGLFSLRVRSTGPQSAQTSQSSMAKIRTVLQAHGSNQKGSEFGIVFACSGGLTYLGNEIVGTLGTLL